MATKDVKEFNGWFNRSYARLKERLSIYGKIDEDAFHDAYLAVRKQIMFSSVGIEDPESYFFGCYRRILQSGARDESRYDGKGTVSPCNRLFCASFSSSESNVSGYDGKNGERI